MNTVEIFTADNVPSVEGVRSLNEDSYYESLLEEIELLQEGVIGNIIQKRQKKTKALQLAKRAGVYEPWMDDAGSDRVLLVVKHHIERQNGLMRDERDKVEHELYLRKVSQGKDPKSRFKVGQRAFRTKKRSLDSLQKELDSNS